MKNDANESANIKAQHPLTPQQDNRAWYVATMNDCIFIVDEPPRPAPVDTHNPNGPQPRVVISMRSGSREAQAIAEQIVAAHNVDVLKCATYDRCPGGCGIDFTEFPDMRHTEDECGGPECNCYEVIGGHQMGCYFYNRSAPTTAPDMHSWCVSDGCWVKRFVKPRLNATPSTEVQRCTECGGLSGQHDVTCRNPVVVEVQRRADAIVDAAIEWHESGQEGTDWFDASERLTQAIEKLLELK